MIKESLNLSILITWLANGVNVRPSPIWITINSAELCGTDFDFNLLPPPHSHFILFSSELIYSFGFNIKPVGQFRINIDSVRFSLDFCFEVMTNSSLICNSLENHRSDSFGTYYRFRGSFANLINNSSYGLKTLAHMKEIFGYSFAIPCDFLQHYFWKPCWILEISRHIVQRWVSFVCFFF